MNSSQSKEMNCDMMHAHQTRDHLESRFEFESLIRPDSRTPRFSYTPHIRGRNAKAEIECNTGRLDSGG